MAETLIIPGLGGSGAGHWQQHWAAREASSEIVEQEDWQRPFLPDWLHTLEARLLDSPGAVLVAHSLGCALVAALAGRPSAANVAGALLVAPADVARLSRQVPSVVSFLGGPPQRLPFPTIMVASRDDPYMDFAGAKAHASGWGSAFVDIGKAGHINVASGFGPWPDGQVLAEGLRGRSASRPQAHRWAAPRPSPHAHHDAGLGIN